MCDTERKTMILYPHLDVNAKGHLTIDGLDATELAREFGTPAYILCEDVIRAQCRTYLNAARTALSGEPPCSR